MKRLIFSGAGLILLAFGATAQQPEVAQIIVHYKFTHVRDTTDRAHPYTENMELFVGKSAAAYRSYDALLAYARFKKAYADAMAASPDGHVSVKAESAGSRTEYYQFPNEQKLFMKDKLVTNIYLVETPMPVIRWAIRTDTTSFGSLHCQKATCHFKGRDYTAWFCPDLPVQTGPWKLNGLPGVIIDARDAKNEVVFQFDGLEEAVPTVPQNEPAGMFIPQKFQGLDNPNSIEIPPGAIKTTQKDFDKLQETLYNDPDAFARMLMVQQQANTPANGPKPDGIKVNAGRPPVINNPIELPGKE